MKQSKVKTVWNLNEAFEAHGKTFHKWGVLFENNDSGIFNVVQGYEPKFKIGIESGYEITPNGQNPAKIKYVDLEYTANAPASKGGSNKNNDSIIWQSCFKAVCSASAGQPVDADKILKFADDAYYHCKALTEGIDMPPEATAPAQEFGPPTAAEPEGDKLPF